MGQRYPIPLIPFNFFIDGVMEDALRGLRDIGVNPGNRGRTSELDYAGDILPV